MNRDLIEDLIEEYTLWLKAKGYPQLSADELHYELIGYEPRPEEDIKWLESFIQRWEEAY
jgi:hypothetical protein